MELEKALAQLLFWIYDFIDTVGAIFDILTGTQAVDSTLGNKRSLLEVFVESAISTKVLLGLVVITIVIAAACMCIKIVKNIVRIKSEGEPTSHVATLKQGAIAVISSVACIFFVFMFISFSSMLLSMVNDVINPESNITLSQHLFELSVGQCYVYDENEWVENEVDYYYDDSGNRVQKSDPTSPDGLAWRTDETGNFIFDAQGKKIPIYIMKVERYHPYKLDEDGSIMMESGWCEKSPGVRYTVKDINWSMSPDEVFGVARREFFWENENYGYVREPMVKMDSFNLFTAYLVAIIMLISMFMLAIGLVKRVYDIIVLMICMPLVCGTIPLDDGARFRTWRETIMSKVLIAFGAVIALNVFYMVGGYIIGGGFEALLTPLDLHHTTVVVLKMVMLIGGAMCINGSQVLVARIFGTSADESREAMQSFAMITSGVRVGALGLAGIGRVAMGAKRLVFGGTNRYGRSLTGILPLAFRGANALAERVGGEKYENSRGARFVRFLGKMGAKGFNSLNNATSNRTARSFSNPGSIASIGGAAHKSNTAFSSNSTKKGK